MKKLLNRLSQDWDKYLLETIVIVVGILVAFGLNTWNENRKSELLEISILKELKENILQDIEDMKINLDNYKTSYQSARIITEALANRTPYHDSLRRHFGQVSLIPLFLPTKAAYENLLNIGITLISNDSLRKGLQRLYEVGYVLMVRRTEMDVENSALEFAKMYRKVMSEYSRGVEARPVDYNSLFENQEFKNMITHKMMELEDASIPFAQSIIQGMRGMIQGIDDALLLKLK